MLLSPRQLEAFRYVMLRGSVTGAALALKVSQPAVSRHIRDLEVRSGIKLFERSGNHLLPTPEARLLLAEVERYSYGIQAVSTFAEELRKRRRGMLHVPPIRETQIHM
jgi:DNA-binding transcriptional LysR family regulator